MKCAAWIVKKKIAPTELLEMSFYRFLEQYFYNYQARTSQLNSDRRPCPHLFHVDNQILFKYGPIKITFQFEFLEQYTLDLIHFGRTKGV